MDALKCFFILSQIFFLLTVADYSCAMGNMWIQAFCNSNTPTFVVLWTWNDVSIFLNLSPPTHAQNAYKNNFNLFSAESR